MFNMVTRILIVDDMPAVRESLRWMLDDEQDLTVVGEAADGNEALKCAAELKPQVVILDVELPGLDGYAVAKQLKASPNPPAIVFLSVHTDEEARRRSRQVGGDAFVVKGDGSTALLTEIRTAVAARHFPRAFPE